MFSFAKLTKVRVMAFGTMSIISPAIDRNLANNAQSERPSDQELTFHDGKV